VNKPAVPVQSRPTSRNVPPSSGGGGAHNPAPAGDNSKRQIVGQYMLGKTIGEGTFGKVKLAVHMPTGEKVSEKPQPIVS
jgi:serine/threonine protein kinase